MLDWVQLLSDHHIYFVSAGPNTGRNEVSVKCPFCGDSDPSEHLGVNLFTNKWNCWRDTTHRGIAPERLICALLGVSAAQATHLVKAYTGASHDEFDALGEAYSAPKRGNEPLTLPPEFEAIRADSLTRKFWIYVQNRGFNDTDRVIKEYSLKCCLTGRWKGRLIIPVFGARSSAGLERLTFNQEIVGSNPTVPTLIGWQGRSIRTVEGIPRYLTSSPDVKRVLYNLQNISKGGDVLYIVEGPFDAIKIDYYGKPKTRATCTFGATPTAEQINGLHKLASKFSRLVLLLDSDATGLVSSFLLNDWLPGSIIASIPLGHKDTDKLSPAEMRRWLNEELD